MGAVQYAEESITVSSTALPFTVATYAPGGLPPVAYASVGLEADSIRWRISGVPPTSTAGTLFSTSSQPFFYVCGQLAVQRWQAIRVTTDATLKVNYFRDGN